MKKILGILLTAGLVAAAACGNKTELEPEKPDNKVTPAFPAKIARTITLEEGTAFEFTPNMAWTLSIPKEQEMLTYFKIMVNDQEMIGYSGKGEANTKVNVKVTGRNEDFENSHILTMTLTMNDEAREIAEIELMKVGSVIEVYQAALSNSGNSFLTDGEGGYVYSETPLEDGETINLYENFRNHLKVTANRNWQATAPEWLDISQKGGNGGAIVTIDLASSDAVRPFGDEDGELTFFVDQQTTLATFNVAIKGCANDFEYSIVNASNAILESSGGTVTGSITAAYGSEVFFAFPGGEEWMEFGKGEGFGDGTWSDEEKSAGLHTKTFSASFSANESYTDSRRAFLFCVPRGAAEGLDKSKVLNADGTVAEAYSAYRIAAYTQQHAIEPVPDDLLSVQSWVGKDDNSQAGDMLFAMIQKYADPADYPAGEWYSEALGNVPVLYKLTLKSQGYGDAAIMKIDHADDYTVYSHPDDMKDGASVWVKSFGKAGDFYNFSFKWEGETDEDGTVTDPSKVTWIQPKHPQAYVICRQNGAVTGAILVEIDKDAFRIPLQNASAGGNTDIGFTVLKESDFGWSDAYKNVPQYKVNGFNPLSKEEDMQGRMSSQSLTLTFYRPEDKEPDPFNIDYTQFKYEFVEDGLQTAQYLRSATLYQTWKEFYYIDDETGERVESNDGYLFAEKPLNTGTQMNYVFNGSGPDQFRILCYDKSKALVCTVYVYYHQFNEFDETE